MQPAGSKPDTPSPARARMAFQRHRSRIETLGILFALSLAYATFRASIESMWMFFLVPVPVAWAEFLEDWQVALVGGTIVILLVAPLPSSLPERRAEEPTDRCGI